MSLTSAQPLYSIQTNQNTNKIHIMNDKISHEEKASPIEESMARMGASLDRLHASVKNLCLERLKTVRTSENLCEEGNPAGDIKTKCVLLSELDEFNKKITEVNEVVSITCDHLQI